MRCTRACSLEGFLPNTPVTYFETEKFRWNASVHETHRELDNIADRLRRGIISEKIANGERKNAEIVLASQERQLAHLVDTLLDPVCRISITILENCEGCGTERTNTCGHLLTHSELMTGLSPSDLDSIDESQQKLVWTVAVPESNNLVSSSFSPLVRPTVTQTGDVQYCVPHDSNGNITFSLTAVDDGGSARGGSDSQGPVFLTYIILPVNQEPSFSVCQCTGDNAGVTSVDARGVRSNSAGACCRNVTNCCTSPPTPSLAQDSARLIPTQFWCSSSEKTAAPKCDRFVQIPRFTEFESRVVLHVDVEQIDFDSEAEFITSIMMNGTKIGGIFRPQGNRCGAFTRVLSYEVPLHLFGYVQLQIKTSQNVNNQFVSQNCHGKSLNAQITLSRGSLTRSMFVKTYTVWKGSRILSNYLHDHFALHIMNGRSSLDGIDMESQQSHTFAVTIGNGTGLFSQMPTLHANGTLEFQVSLNQAGQANLFIVLHDDGFGHDVAAGTLSHASSLDLPYPGKNVSISAEVTVCVAESYAMIQFNATSFNSTLVLTEAHVMETARRIIAAGLGLPLSRLVVPSNEFLLQLVGIDVTEALDLSARGVEYTEWLQVALPGIQLNVKAFVKNWDKQPFFNTSHNRISMMGFEHPASQSFVLPGYILDLVSGPDTPIDFQGREQVLFDIVPVRFRSVKSGPWQNGTHGAVGVANILTNCAVGCQSASSSAGFLIPPYCTSNTSHLFKTSNPSCTNTSCADACYQNCVASSSDLSDAHSSHCKSQCDMPSCFNGSLQFNQTGFGYGEAEYHISMRSPVPANDNYITSVPVYPLRVLSLLDLQLQRTLTVVVYEAISNITLSFEQYAIVFGMPHSQRLQNATFEVVAADSEAAQDVFAVPPTISIDGTLSFALRPGSYGNTSFVLRMSTTDDEVQICICTLTLCLPQTQRNPSDIVDIVQVYGLCASSRLQPEGGRVEQRCVTSRVYMGSRPHNEDLVVQYRPVADFITTNFTIAVLPVNNAPFFQLNCRCDTHSALFFARSQWLYLALSFSLSFSLSFPLLFALCFRVCFSFVFCFANALDHIVSSLAL